MKRILSITLLLTISFILKAEYLEKEKAISMLKNLQESDFPANNEVCISNESTKIEEDGTGIITYDFYKKVLNNTARKDNIVKFYFNRNYYGIKVKHLELIKKDGSIIKFNPDTLLTEKISNSSASSNIYTTEDIVLMGTIPNIEIGDILYEKVDYTIKKARLKGHYSGLISIESPTKYLHSYSKIIIPSDKELYIHNLNDKGFKFTYDTFKKDGNTIHEWTVKDNPILIPEPSMEENEFTTHIIKYTTIKNWEYISEWYHNLVQPHLVVTDEIKKKSIELTKGLKTRKEKAAKLFYWVASKIRYLGVDGEDNRPGLEPHDVSYTFSTRGGVCRDKAALLTAMLREVGIGSDVILIKSGGRLHKAAPVSWFNHAITVSYDENNQPEFFFDPTDERTKDFLPKYEEDNSYLIASKPGSTLKETPVSPPDNNNSSVNISLKIDKEGDAKGQISFLFSGVADGVLRQIISTRTPHQIKQMISYLITRIHPNVAMLEMTNTKPDNMNEDFKINVSVKIPQFAKKTEKYTFVPFCASDINMHFLSRYILEPFSLTSRNYDFKMNGAFSLDINYDIELDSKINTLSLPTPNEIDIEGFKTKFTTKTEGKTLKSSYHFETSQIHFKKEDYQKIRSEIVKLSQNEDMYMIKKEAK